MNNGGYVFNKKTQRFEWQDDDKLDGFGAFLIGVGFCAVFIVCFFLSSHA